MTDDPVSQKEIEAFVRKLDDFEAALSSQERDLLRAILLRAGGDKVDDVEGHGLARISIAALVLAVADTVGAANASTRPIHHTAPTVAHVHHVVSVVGDEKGGAETITYTTSGGSSSG